MRRTSSARWAAVALGIASASFASMLLWHAGVGARRFAEIRRDHAVVAKEIFRGEAVHARDDGFHVAHAVLPRRVDQETVLRLVGGAEVRIAEKVTARSSGEVIDGAVVYGVGDDARVWTEHAGGVEEWVLGTHDARRPLSRWSVRGASLSQRSDGVALLDGTGRALAHVSAPRAFGERGRTISARLEASGDTLSLFVDARAGERVLVDPLWTVVPPMGAARRGATSSLLPNGDVLLVGGEDASGNPVSTAERYSLIDGTWTSMAGPQLMRHGAVTLRNGKVFIGGGLFLPASPTGSCRFYDAETSTFSDAAMMPAARTDYTMVTLADGDVLLAGGLDTGGNPLATSILYSVASNSWSAGPTMIVARANAVGVLRQDGTVLITGGRGAGLTPIASTEVYANGNFAAGQPMTAARTNHSATMLYDGRVVVAGGNSGAANPVNTVEISTSNAAPWTALPSMGAAREQHAAVLMPSGHLALVGGLNNGTPLVSGDLLGDALTFTPLPLLTTARGRASVALLHTGKLLVAGGQGSAGPLATTELLDEYLSPGPGFWTRPPGSPALRMRPVTATLPDGRILTVGGLTQNGSSYSADAAIFNPTTNAWTTTTSLTFPRGRPGITTLPNGRIFVVGGTINFSATAEIFDPATETWTTTPAHPDRAYQHFATMMDDGRVLAITDYVTQYPQARIFDLGTGTWSATGTISPRHNSAAFFSVPGGAILIGGASAAFVGTNVVHKYSIATNTWDVVAPTINARAFPTAVKLDSNHILLAGGSQTQRGVSLSAVEMYTIDTNTWTALNPMPKGRSDFTMTRLSTGQYLVEGGITQITNNAYPPPQQAEVWLYTPGSDTWTVLPATRPRGPDGFTEWWNYGIGPTLHALPGGDAISVGDSEILSTYRFVSASNAFVDIGYLPERSMGTGASTYAELPNGHLRMTAHNFYAFNVDYNPFTQTWTTFTPATQTRDYQSVRLGLPNYNVLFAGTASTMTTYDPIADDWTPAPDFLSGCNALAYLADGGVLCAAATSQTYDPETNDATFSANPPVGSTQIGSLVVLPSDLVFAPFSAGAHLWSRATGAWVSANGPVFSNAAPWALPLPNGKLLAGTGSNLYNAKTGAWTTTATNPSITNRSAVEDWAVTLASGRVLFGGQAVGNVSDLYDWQTERYATAPGGQRRWMGTARRLPTQEVMVFGAVEANAVVTRDADTLLFNELPPTAAAGRPNLVSVSPTQQVTTGIITLTGTQLLGVTVPEPPVVMLSRTDSGWPVYATVVSFSSSTVEARLPEDMPPGAYHVWLTSHGVPSYYKDLFVQRTTGKRCTTASACETGFCVDGVCCNAACSDGPCDACSAAQGASADGVCTILPATTVCRAQQGSCDLPELCTLGTGVCPADAHVAAGSTCRAAAGDCDVAETCDGGIECPVDVLTSGGVVCRGATDLCDAIEMCNGASPACPLDGALTAGTTCRSSASSCDAAETCDGVALDCPVDAPAIVGTVCRAAQGPCDVADTCDGVSFDCLGEAVANAGTPCRASAGLCDLPELCDGIYPACPADVLAASGTSCRPASGPCDLSEVCSGASVACPADNFAASTVVCHPSTGACDPAETCTGTSIACPVDQLASAGAVCRASQGICDSAETCDGSTALCPANSFRPSTDLCRGAASMCDVAEYCSGAGAFCPPDIFASANIECRPSTGACDVAERCTGSGNSCPADGFLAAGVVCHASTGACDPYEACTGTSATCPVDVLSAAGAPCRLAQGGCDEVESCDGVAAACPDDARKSAGTLCRDALGPCDEAARCDGSAVICPANSFKPSTVECRPAADSCDAAESCSGQSAACPDDRYKPKGAMCRPSTTMCDVAETCTGDTLSCPSDTGASDRVGIVRDANLRAAVGIPYRYNANGYINLSGPKTPTTFHRCEGVTLPANFIVDRQTGLIAWTPAIAASVELCIAVETSCGHDEYRFTVAVSNNPPDGPIAHFTFSPASPSVQTNVAFDASTSRSPLPDLPLYAYDWRFGDDTLAHGVTSEHAYALGGAYTTRLTAFDAYGTPGIFTDVIPVGDPYCDLLPRVTITTQPLVVYGKSLVTHTCDCEDVRWFDWDLGDGKRSTDASPTHEYEPGRYRVRLVGSRSPGCIGQDSTELEVRSSSGLVPPICEVSAVTTAAPVPFDVELRGFWVDPNDGVIARAQWTLDDANKTTSSDPAFNVTLTEPGLYHATLLVTGSTGLTCQRTVELNALSANGEIAPKILSQPNLVASCGKPYHYDLDNEDIPTVRGRSPAARFSLGKPNSDGSIDGAVTGMTIDEQLGTISWLPPATLSGKQRVIVGVQNGAGLTQQEFEIDVQCGSESGCGCEVGAHEDASSRQSLWLVLALAILCLPRARRAARYTARSRPQDR